LGCKKEIKMVATKKEGAGLGTDQTPLEDHKGDQKQTPKGGKKAGWLPDVCDRKTKYEDSHHIRRISFGQN